MAQTQDLLAAEVAAAETNGATGKETPLDIGHTPNTAATPSTPNIILDDDDDDDEDNATPNTPLTESANKRQGNIKTENGYRASGSASPSSDDERHGIEMGTVDPAGSHKPSLDALADDNADPESIAKSVSHTHNTVLQPPNSESNNNKMNLNLRNPDDLTPGTSDSRDIPNLDFGNSLNPKEREWIERVLKCCEETEGFDLYQLMAFESNTKNTWKQYMHYYYGILKAILCALTQSLGMCIIMVDYVETGMDCREADSYQDWEAICPGGLTELFTTGENPWVIFGSLQYKILAFLFSAFLAFYCFDQLLDVESGMYRKMKHAADLPFVNSTWLKIGLYINVLASILAVYGAFIVVFFSENGLLYHFYTLDMVLNSVALFFVVELDDLLVKTADYERIQAYIQDYNHVAKTAVGSVATPSFLKSPRVQKCKICYKKCGMGCRMCWRGISCCCRCLYGTPYKMLQYFTIILCFILPFFIFVCYDDNVKCD